MKTKGFSLDRDHIRHAASDPLDEGIDRTFVSALRRTRDFVREFGKPFTVGARRARATGPGSQAVRSPGYIRQAGARRPAAERCTGTRTDWLPGNRC